MLVCRYAQYGDVSPKVDVYAFGVVLYELISAKEAIVKENGSVAESKGLVALVNILSITLLQLIISGDRQAKSHRYYVCYNWNLI